MTKTDIINAVAFVTVPEGARLDERNLPGTDPESGILISHITGKDTGGIKIVSARMFAEQLTADAKGLDGTPDAAFFETVHKSTLEMNQYIIDGLTIPELERTTIAEHKLMIARLQKIAQELGITYSWPLDPLLAA